MNKDDKLCSDILADLSKNKKERICLITGHKTFDNHMSNEEWNFFKKIQYATKYFIIPSEYFNKL